MPPTRMTTYIADCHGGLAWVVVRGGWPACFHIFMTFCNRRAIIAAKSEIPPEFDISALRQQYQCVRRSCDYVVYFVVHGIPKNKH